MDTAQEFEIGDRVCWEDYYSEDIECGRIEEIKNDIMNIFLGDWEKPNGKKYKILVGARKIKGQWKAYRPLQGHKELIYKNVTFTPQT